MLKEQAQISPDRAAIRADLEFMTRRWGELTQPVMFEVRAFKEGKGISTLSKESMDTLECFIWNFRSSNNNDELSLERGE